MERFTLGENIHSELSIQKEKVRRIPICLIIPPSTFLADERVFPFLGPLKVAAELRKNGNSVEVLDLSGYGNFEEVVDQYVSNTDIRIFGLTATTPQIPAAGRVVERIRSRIHDAQIILGGPHATLVHTAMQEDLKVGSSGRGTEAFYRVEKIFDKLVIGDGETSIFYAIDPKNKNKVIDAGNLKSNLFMSKGTLENYSYPARDLIDLDTYHYSIDGKRAFSVIGQLGCPFECGFCGGRDSNVFRVARTRRPSDVVNEIEEVVKMSIKNGNPYEAVMFYDDELNVVPRALEDLCSELINLQGRLGFEMRFRGFVKAELFTSEQAKLMYKAGFRILLTGVESGSDEILNTMRKHTSRKINTQCIENAHNAGLKVKALMSIGHPGESEITIADSVEWVLKNKPDDVDWTIITQYPGSPYFDKSVYNEEKDAWLYTEPKTGNRLWSRSLDYLKEAEYYKGIPGEYTAYVWTDHLSSEMLVKFRDQAEKVTRENLKLSTIVSTIAQQFEHSMGQSRLPSNILKSSSK